MRQFDLEGREVGSEAVTAGSARELLDAVPSRRWQREEQLDRVMVAWMCRFAFVTASALAERWGVSEQRMRARLRRLEAAGYVRRRRLGPREPARVLVTEAGGELAGLSVRTARGRESLVHELAVVKRVIAIERHFAAEGASGARVLTERDQRRDQQAEGARWSVPVVRERGRVAQRWPDYVVATGAGRTAVELEFSLKGTTRLRSIVRAYLRSGAYEFVDFVVMERPQDAGLWRVLGRVLEEEQDAERAARLPALAADGPVVRIVAWRDPLPRLHAGMAPFPPLGDLGAGGGG